MSNEHSRKSNVVELDAGKRELIDKGFKEPNEIPKHVPHHAELSALDQLMTILDGRRGH
jgi:hypothetical protein